MYSIGVDLGGTNIAVGIVDEDYKIIAGAHTPTSPERGAQAVVDDIAECINNALLFSGTDLAQCDGVGVGSPGVCNGETGVVTRAVNLGWTDVPVGEMLRQRLGLPVHIDNDGNCAALGETASGAARGCDSAIMVTLGTGVGGGIIIDGKIYSGYRGLGGEIGHTCICIDGEECGCGQRGCWEAYASASALIKQGTRAARENPESQLAKMGALDGLKIFTAMHDGDETARRVVERYCQYVGVGLVNLINGFYPQTIILGGGICNQGETLLQPVREYVCEHFFIGDREKMPKIVRAELGNDAGIIGAAALCRQK
jgi:glucokinase